MPVITCTNVGRYLIRILYDKKCHCLKMIENKATCNFQKNSQLLNTNLFDIIVAKIVCGTVSTFLFATKNNNKGFDNN